MYKKAPSIAVLFLLNIVFAQFIHAQQVVVKTNLPYLATATPNIGIEIAMSKKTTFELLGSIHPFEFSEKRRLKHWTVQPEFRYWACEAFNRHFVGIHGLGGKFNVGGIDIPAGDLKSLKDSRYQGYAYGGGISYGYQWIVSPRWNFEFTVGAGYLRLHYEQYPCTSML